MYCAFVSNVLYDNLKMNVVGLVESVRAVQARPVLNSMFNIFVILSPHVKYAPRIQVTSLFPGLP